MNKLQKKKLARYFERHLTLLPSSYECHDPNKMAIVFYSLVGLSILDEDITKKYKDNKKWLHNLYNIIELPIGAISGFVSTSTMKFQHIPTMNLPNTLFALLTLVCLNDHDFFDKILEKESLYRFVSSCQLPNGSFSSYLDISCSGFPSLTDSSDLRYCYIAVAILYVTGCRSWDDFETHIDAEKLVEFTLSKMCIYGGFGDSDESHSGYTSCALSLLYLLGKLDSIPVNARDLTVEWLLKRQISNQGHMTSEENNKYYDTKDYGGFQGRENKLADTCYGFWCLNSLSILNEDITSLCNTLLTEEYLLNRTLKNLVGGFAKNYQEDPDIYHSFLGIACLELISGSFDGILCIPKHISYSWFPDRNQK